MFEKVLLAAWFRLPQKIRFTLTAAQMGQLTARDPRLHSREVPRITVQELLDAMKFDEAASYGE